MTFVGRFLIVVQVVLSLVFMAFAGAVFTVQRSWMAEAKARQSTIDGLRNDLETKDGEFEKYKQDAVAVAGDSVEKLLAQGAPDVRLLQRAQTAEAAVNRLQQDNERLAKLKEVADTEKETNKTLAAIARSEADARDEEAKISRIVNENLHKANEQLTQRIVTLEDSLFAGQLVIAQMQKKHTSTLEDLATVREIVLANGFTMDPAEYRRRQAPAPYVQGVVLGTRTSKRDGTEFIEISIGSDDGLVEGHSLFIYSPLGEGKYLGSIKIVYVTPDRAVGTVDLKAKNGVIQKGDNVTTKL